MSILGSQAVGPLFSAIVADAIYPARQTLASA